MALKYFTGKNVFDAALDRIRWLYDEFPNVMVSTSGGKDSTVIFNLALLVAREKGRLPLKVMWLDQEGEWQATVDTVRDQMEHADVEPFWYQIPFVLFNATSTAEPWLQCWNPADRDRWMHPQVEYSIKENRYGTDRFHKLLQRVVEVDQPEGTANLGGMRTEESPTRTMAMTLKAKYKWATFGRCGSAQKRQYVFHPIYDWSYTDVWKAIHSNGWPYNPIYDKQWQLGTPIPKMRVSNIHHETAVQSLFTLQEIEPETYERLTQRISGIDTAGKMGKADYFVSTLPPMFKSWPEYRDYLTDNLITNPEYRERFHAKWKTMDAIYAAELGAGLYRVQISSILTNDWEFIKLTNFEHAPQVLYVRYKVQGLEWKGRYAGQRDEPKRGAGEADDPRHDVSTLAKSSRSATAFRRVKKARARDKPAAGDAG